LERRRDPNRKKDILFHNLSRQDKKQGAVQDDQADRDNGNFQNCQVSIVHCACGNNSDMTQAAADEACIVFLSISNKLNERIEGINAEKADNEFVNHPKTNRAR